jgi:hypothetical protein
VVRSHFHGEEEEEGCQEGCEEGRQEEEGLSLLLAEKRSGALSVGTSGEGL